ncbi:MAG: Asp-tRNA(Asn)/Glu-tRNA(Gln) amidotransferase GatCAB subunit B, partial [Planctomycetota bacterium]
WDDAAEQTFVQREKELSADYRYFPDPDLLPIRLPSELIDDIRDSLGEMPAATRERLQTQYGIKPYDADVIVNQGPSMIDYFETVAEISGDGRRAASWMMQDVMRTIKDDGLSIESFPVDANKLGCLVQRIVGGKIDNHRARDVFDYLRSHDVTVSEAESALGIESVGEDDLKQLCEELLAANPQIVADVRGGKQQAVGALIGQAKKKNKNANPQAIRQLLLELINSK